MEREQFIAAETGTWWLLERDVDYRIEDLRRNLGASFAWTDRTWYLESQKLEEVYDFIHEQRSELFYELQQATDDDRRQRWLDSVIELKSPPASVPAESTLSPSPAATATSAGPPRRSPFGSRAQAGGPAAAAKAGTGFEAAASTRSATPRRSPFGSRAQAGTSGAAADSPAQPAAPFPTSPPPRPSAFRSRAQTGAAGAAADSPAQPAAPSPTGPPPRPSAFGSRAQAGGPAAGPDVGRTASNAHESPAAGQLGQVDEQIQTVMSGLSADELSAMARELGVSPEEVEAMVQEPDFAGLVAEEQAQLEPATA